MSSCYYLSWKNLHSSFADYLLLCVCVCLCVCVWERERERERERAHTSTNSSPLAPTVFNTKCTVPDALPPPPHPKTTTCSAICIVGIEDLWRWCNKVKVWTLESWTNDCIKNYIMRICFCTIFLLLLSWLNLGGWNG